MCCLKGSETNKYPQITFLLIIIIFLVFRVYIDMVLLSHLRSKRSSCLDDEPETKAVCAYKLYGQVYDATRQCNFLYGPEYGECTAYKVNILLSSFYRVIRNLSIRTFKTTLRLNKSGQTFINIYRIYRD